MYTILSQQVLPQYFFRFMKHPILLAFILLMLSGSLYGQAPQAFNYQAVVRTNTGISLANRPVRFRIAIQQGNAGPAVYEEEHLDTTNADGLAILQIGRGTLINNSPAFSTIIWGSQSYYLGLEIDTVGNSSFVNLGSFELLSVPYALYSNNGLPAGTQSGQMLQWNGSTWVAITPGIQNQVLTFCDGRPLWTATGQCPGTLTAINCGGATPSGQMNQGQSGTITVSIPYTGGNGGLHNGQTVSSTGISGLTATASGGSFANGSGSIVYTITGTPGGTGNANFAINIGGQTCTLTQFVNPIGTISSLNCLSATNNGSMIQGVAASGVTTGIPYTGGNAGFYGSQSFASTGVTGLTANIAGGAFASGSGSVTFTISGTPVGSGTASFAVTLGGQTCTFTRSVSPSTVSTLSCATATNNGTLTWGLAASGVTSSIPYTGGNGGGYGAQSISSTGVTGLTASIGAGSFVNGSGSLSFTITGTPNGSGNANFAITMGGQTCTLTRSVVAGSISSITCPGTSNGTLIGGVAASGVSNVLSYTGGNGGGHSGQTVSSTGITGLTATLTSGSFVNGNGTLTYTITGTPSGVGTANFAINIGGRTCTLSRTVNPGSISTINCGSATNNGTLIHPVAASGVSSIIAYTGGNGGMHTGQTVSSTGVTGLTATLAAGSFASGNGSLTYTITGTPSATGTASFAINIGGASCTLQRTVVGGSISGINCTPCCYNPDPNNPSVCIDPTGCVRNNGTLVVGRTPSGVTTVLTYSGGNGGSYPAQTVNSTGVTGLTATISAGNFAIGDGTLTFTISGSAPSTTGNATFAVTIGGRSCTFSVPVENGRVSSISCSSLSLNCPVNTTVSVSYTGGNGGPYPAQDFTIGGVRFTLPAGNFNVGSGSVTYTLTGSCNIFTYGYQITLGGACCGSGGTIGCSFWSVSCPFFSCP